MVTRTGFLDLPWELRTPIYQFLLMAERGTVTELCTSLSQNYKLYRRTVFKAGGAGEPNFGWSAQFLRVCKLVHAEATPFLYKHMYFEMELLTLHRGFLCTYGASHIRYLELRCTEFGQLEATRTFPSMISACPDLRFFKFSVTPSTPDIYGCHLSCNAVHPCVRHQGQLNLLVLTFAKIITTTHPHLRLLTEFRLQPASCPSWYKMSDAETYEHPPRSYDRPTHRLTPEYDERGHFIDIEERVGELETVKKRAEKVKHDSKPISKRPPWRV